ncbi:UpxY family transcription antiterminator [Danxiaibacter flavus]|uniref:UpxY family transcription antiterminator n=1 Tax=Danxiaibacter flavus TaxID=3049108 RepID=A0ABV3ZLC0_9BACT|nr:UpxY family transcription antiterminator [Chitinophagaceae bacterium DXS]
MKKFRPSWYVIYTRPRHEKKLASELTEMTITSFLPTIKSLRTWNDRKKFVDSPLFPSYIFVYLKTAQEYFTCLGHDSVLFFIKQGKDICQVPQSIIDDIKLIVANGKNIEVCEDKLSPGKRLIITEGPFTGFSCEIIEYKGRQRIWVRIDLLKRNILLDLPIDYLAQTG